MTEITMPKLSDTMSEGAVVAWHKAVGAAVERGEVLAEIETDKATMELEAFASGQLLEIRVPAGTTVPVGTVIGVIGRPGEQPAAPPPAERAAAAEAPPLPTGGKERVAAPPPPSPPPPPVVLPAAPADLSVAPLVRRRARERGVDLAQVAGSGPDGRIMLADVELAATGPAASTGIVPAAPAASDRAAPPAADAGGEPLSRMRAAIARTVSDAWRTIPHFQVSVDVAMTNAEQLRRQFEESGRPVSVNDLIVWAVAQALGKFPRLNASLRGERIVLHADVNIGIVVRLDDGLLVPVLRGCAGQPADELAERSRKLVERARHGQLSDTEMSGGTFAISNLGMYGVRAFTALILPPMAAVLAVGAVRDALAVKDGRPAVVREMTVTLSADHRLVDGAYAAEFLREVRELLELPHHDPYAPGG